MAALLFLLILAAVAGVLGAVLKAIAVVVFAVLATVIILAWLTWRSFRRALERGGGATIGSTTITIGRAERDPAGSLPPERDDRY